MSTVRRLERLAKRVGKVLTIETAAPITAAARKMHDNEVGCLIVLDGQTIAGIVSERDIVAHLAEHPADDRTPVRDVMTDVDDVVFLSTAASKVGRPSPGARTLLPLCGA